MYTEEITAICCNFYSDEIYNLFGIHVFYLKSCWGKICDIYNICSIQQTPSKYWPQLDLQTSEAVKYVTCRCMGVVVRSSVSNHPPGGEILLGVITTLYSSHHQHTYLNWTYRLVKCCVTRLFKCHKHPKQRLFNIYQGLYNIFCFLSWIFVVVAI